MIAAAAAAVSFKIKRNETQLLFQDKVQMFSNTNFVLAHDLKAFEPILLLACL